MFSRTLCPGGGGGGVFDISLCGKLWPGRHTLTLCKTKIADFPILFKTELRFLIACVRHLTRNHAPCKTMINKNFCCSLVRRTYAQAVYRPRKDTMFKTNIDKIDSLFKTKNPEKHTLAGRTSPLSPYKGVPPLPRAFMILFRHLGQTIASPLIGAFMFASLKL